MTHGEFREIAHSGGKITIRIDARDFSYQPSYRGSGGGRMVMIAVYALSQGVPIRRLNLAGLGSPLEGPPFPNCFVVLICSDSEGHFGHHCPVCDGYWRSGAWPNVCPYCRHADDAVQFLSEAQRRYVAVYCEKLRDALTSGQDGEYTIDMDEVADAVGKEGEKPAFYVSEQSQQWRFDCVACGMFNDVLGRSAYCSSCGTRNDSDLFKQRMSELHGQVATSSAGDIVRDAISAFDNLVGQYVKQLLHFVPLSRRRAALLERRFHDLEGTAAALKDCFDLDLFEDVAADRRARLKMMFHRRHVYEHNGGEVDEDYLEKSGDTSVRLKQHLAETGADLHQLLSDLDRMTRTLHKGFHELLPPISAPIAEHKETLAHRKSSVV